MRKVKSELKLVSLIALPVLLSAGVSNTQYPLLDAAANKVIPKLIKGNLLDFM